MLDLCFIKKLFTKFGYILSAKVKDAIKQKKNSASQVLSMY